MLLIQERTMVKRVEPAPERIEPESKNALVTKPEAALAISILETAPPTTPMPLPTSATSSQDIQGTPTIAKMLLLLDHNFDGIITLACSASAKSLESKSHHIDKLPSEAPSNANTFPYAAKV